MPKNRRTHTVHHKDLESLLEVTHPVSILLIDPNPEGLPQRWLANSLTTRVIRLHGDLLPQLQALERCDLGVIANTVEYLDPKTTGMVLARLRDVNTRRFVALVPIGKTWREHTTHWEAANFLGYGMTQLACYIVDGKPLHLYHYAIETYKTTPEWFNSRHWAHPERWKP